jgi:UDP-N-acetylglucosamine--N-acetylmuramyl-(pentapeptide) pyrophosphoryl-undecaprenol N-acetylglucosamine transferase
MKIVIAGGGTAGHVEPALAVARTFQQSHPDAEIIFLGTRSGLETRLVPEAGYSLRLIPKVVFPRTVSFKTALLPFTFAGAVAQTWQALHGADLVIGFGGYVCTPAYVAAAIKRIPIVIHEANAKPGLANRLGAFLTPHCAIAHPITYGKLSKALMTGIPLRPNISSAFEGASQDWESARQHAKKSLGFPDTEPLLFIFGGSQGSKMLNDVIVSAQAELAERGINILHGVGANNPLPPRSPKYHPQSYITDMATAYLAADVIISRSGAITCSEVAALGKYALFIPLPIGNGEQQLNAATLVSEHRAEIVQQQDFTATWLVSHVARILQRSAGAHVAGSDRDLHAASKIAALMDHALSGGR